MVWVRFREGLIVAVFCAGCAHQIPQQTKSEHSLGWPIASEQAKANSAPVTTEKSVDLPKITSIVLSQNPNDVKPAKHSPVPPPIEIPKAKDFQFSDDSPMIFDIPVSYNSKVKYWIEYYQTAGRPWYTKWLERSSRYLPAIQKTLKKHGLPQDLAYIAMIESGFSPQASSIASAVGPWQFIKETAKVYGLHINWWLDERRDFQKSTDAAAKYLKKMYGMFHNWYLVAAGYNTGENRIKKIMERRGTKSFWKMAQYQDLENETRDYVPKLIAALLIAKAPQLYGFNHLKYNEPFSFELFHAPGGTNLRDLAGAIGVTMEHMQELNPELVKGYIPDYVEGRRIRIPKGSAQLVAHYIRRNLLSER